MISHKYQCIFVHIPKTAGTSIEYKLGHFMELKRGVQDHRTIREVQPLSLLDLTRLVLAGHMTYSSKYILSYIRGIVAGERLITLEQYNAYFKFTFVRNPWSRVFSWYRNVMRDEIHKNLLGISADCSFKEFLNNHLGQRHLRPQLSWITDIDGKIPLDFIGRFENLEEDFLYVCNVLGIKARSLPKLISGNGRHYAGYYDEEMRDIVAEQYAEEIALFEFEFGE